MLTADPSAVSATGPDVATTLQQEELKATAEQRAPARLRQRRIVGRPRRVVARWKAERCARRQREQRAEEERARAQLERELEEARDRRRAEEAALQANRARWEEARRAEERVAAELGLMDGRHQDRQPNPPGAGRARYCYVCRWPGVRVLRRCPNAK